jgi:hypothetical protein
MNRNQSLAAELLAKFFVCGNNNISIKLLAAFRLSFLYPHATNQASNQAPGTGAKKARVFSCD